MLKNIEIRNQYIRNQKITKIIMPNTLGIAKKGILEKTGMPIELGISSGTIRVIVKKKPYSISKA